jgi:hypothetical protein
MFVFKLITVVRMLIRRTPFMISLTQRCRRSILDRPDPAIHISDGHVRQSESKAKSETDSTTR